ncbi:hypothetical protein SLE2022_364610 [Rubroshorea leprosula]
MATVDDAKLHIAMFPWLAFGHLIPFLEVAKLLAQKGHQISYISTPRNIDRLPKLPPSLSPSIHFINLPLPHVEHLPENAEATTDLPYNKIPYLKLAYDGLKDSLVKFLETSHPDWLIYDFAPYWLPPLARNLGIPNAIFSIYFANALCVVKPTSPLLSEIVDDRKHPEDFTVPPNWISFPSPIALKLFEINRIFDSVTAVDSQVSDLDRIEGVFRGCDAIFPRGCWEFLPEYLHLLQELHQKPVIPVGLLPPTYEGINDDDEPWRSMKEWLDKQEKGSIVYIAFGSEAKPSQEEVTEIALGLELAGLPFFWVLKTRLGLADSEVVTLPEGFEERTRGRGWVWTSWAPQPKILSHDSVGGILTHSGWGSVVEALMNERAVILLTFLSEQGLNARILEEKKMGYSIPRNENDGSFTKEAVAKSLRLVMVEEEGKVYRDKAKEMKGLFGDRDLQDHYTDNLVMYLKNHRNQKNSRFMRV